MLNTCPICEHKDREKIESVLFKMSPENSEELLRLLSEAYDVTILDLKNHMLFHTAYGDTSDNSIARQLKLREVSMLADAINDQLSTIKILGSSIRKLSKDTDEEVVGARRLTKSMVDLYTGTSESMRRSVQTLSDINQQLNGPKDSGLDGLSALAMALNNSRKENTHDSVD